MISFNKPIKLNGAELRQELNDAGITISFELGSVIDTADGLLWLDIADKDKQAAAVVVAAHNGTI